jgi:LPXTG-motif cell wall-anchored protein
MLEYSDLEGAYVVRARHAHAWTRAWVGDRWVDVDTTPPTWLVEEERLAPAWQKLADLFRWASYRWAQRTGFEAGVAWYVLLGALVVVLGWRIVRRKRVARARPEAAVETARAYPGLDSEFYAVERAIASRGVPRSTVEAVTTWAARAAMGIDESACAQLEHALQLHLRYRFDPAALEEGDRRALRETATSLARSLETR